MGSEPGHGTAAAIAAAAAAAGTRFAFGVPGGGSNLDLIDACGSAGSTSCSATARPAGSSWRRRTPKLTGAPGLALATRGPGAVSAANGSAHALLDRCPVLLVTDAVAHTDRDRVSHQRIDHASIFTAVAKASLEIAGHGARSVANRALALALTPPWGPVHLDTVPDAEYGTVAADGEHTIPALPAEWSRRLAASTRPLLLVGVGARRATAAVRALVDATGIPTLLTYKAKGFVPEDHPAFVGLLTGATIEADALDGADLLLCVGLDPVELIPSPWPYRAPVLSLTPWPVRDNYLPVTSQVVDDPARHLPEIGQLVGPSAWDCPRTALGLADRLNSDPAASNIGAGLTPSALVAAVRDAAPRGTVATVDAGAHMLVAMPLWTAYSPGEALISSGLATMGFALPAAIAAALARPTARVVCFIGDGGLGMCLAELEVLARRRLDVLVVVFNDSLLSLIDIKQKQGRGGPAVTFGRTDFTQVAADSGFPRPA